jgi:hypothetical protein
MKKFAMIVTTSARPDAEHGQVIQVWSEGAGPATVMGHLEDAMRDLGPGQQCWIKVERTRPGVDSKIIQELGPAGKATVAAGGRYDLDSNAIA